MNNSHEWLFDALDESGVIAYEEKKSEQPFKNIILECTGQIYDGVDEEFEKIISMHFRRYYGVISGIKNSQIIVNTHLYPGEPLFHISALLYICNNIINRSDPIEQKRYLSRLIVPYIIKWIDSQVLKLIAYENALGRIQEASQLSEFHLSLSNFKKNKDDCATELCLDSMLQVLSHLSIILELNDLVLTYAESVNQLEKILSRLMNHKPTLLKKSNLPKFNNILTVFKFESSLATLSSLVKLEKYTQAEAYANKSLSIIEKLHPSHRQKCTYYLYLNFALIAKTSNDIEAVLSHLSKVFECTDKDEYYIAFVRRFATYLPSICEYAAYYFEEKSEFDKAIKYYLEALRFSDSLQDQKKYIFKLKSLGLALTKQLALELMTPDYQSVLSKAIPYLKPKTTDIGLLYLYTQSESSAHLLRTNLQKHKINFSNLANPKTDIEKNAIAIEIDYEFDTDLFRVVLLKICNQQNIVAKKIQKKERSEKDQSRVITPKEESCFSYGEIESTKKANNKTKKKKTATAQEKSIIKVNKWAFLEQKRNHPLTIVEFTLSKKYSIPVIQTVW